MKSILAILLFLVSIQANSATIRQERAPMLRHVFGEVLADSTICVDTPGCLRDGAVVYLIFEIACTESLLPLTYQVEQKDGVTTVNVRATAMQAGYQVETRGCMDGKYNPTPTLKLPGVTGRFTLKFVGSSKVIEF